MKRTGYTALILRILEFWQIIQCRHFGYSRNEQNSWHNYSQSCSGYRQSPIAIDSEKAISLAIPALEMVGFDNLVPRPITIFNNGHSVDIRPMVPFAKIFGALLPGEFEVHGLHFHWGKKNNRGSEHVINGMRFAMEMHIVTRNLKYNSMEEAMENSDGLAVMAFFFEVREHESNGLDPILNELNMIKHEGTSFMISQSFTLSSLLPFDKTMFYMYRGSLTTPPCSEAVTWIVFPDPQPMSYKQISQFRQLSINGDSLVDNYRHIQSLGKRKVYARRFPTETANLKMFFPNFSSPEFWN
ncbi:carbonic anhydrase 2 [Cimex lectularius]|uniref:Carbonic anhydrase n=1 Tax=Cimex lectularius TaxID=79782 RepID=A0A8I6RHL1_CIMLE|nr:carbonic anhydrase 2 [Cimex lectularius]